MKRLVPFLLVAALASSCAGTASRGGAGIDSGVQGRTMAGPTCPAEQSESACPDRPVIATVVVKDPSGKQVAKATSGSDGRFKIPLPPGTYVVVGERAAGLHRITGPIDATVRAGRFTTITVTFDTGIR